MRGQAAVAHQAWQRALARGDVMDARRALDTLADGVGDHAADVHELAQGYMRLGDPVRALGWYERAVALDPACVDYRYNLSTALLAMGRMEDAEAALDAVIATRPEDWDAWYNRSTLRRQTPQRNHVMALEQAWRRTDLRGDDRVPLGHALAKEYEDLGRHAESFRVLTQAASARRALLSYRVEEDESVMQALVRQFDADHVREAVDGHVDVRPVFVIGLPRSGTTLVDRILSAHSDIDSHGESNDLAVALMQATGPCASKDELLERSLQINPQVLGAEYVRRLAARTGVRVVDKTPGNFLYLGLVARALPQARIVYVRRQPMDVCYAIYKTLFRMACPYSYDLDDLGRYWLAFDALMRHWQQVLPVGSMLTVDYEQLVTEPEPTARAMLAHIDMPWQDACLHFERNPLPSLTASAAQVRQPIYTSSIGKWRRHAHGLEPLARRLREAGISIDEERHHV